MNPLLYMFCQVPKEWSSLLYRTVLGSMTSNLVPETKSIYIFCLEIPQKASNLFLMELIFGCPTTILNGFLTLKF